MSTDSDLESGGRLRPHLRPWLVAGLFNALMAAFLLGVPYLRGPRRAEEVLPRFAAFAACYFGAEAAPRPGLGLPPGERSRYASLVLGGPDDWPGRCRDLLAAIPPEASPFLFPAVKNAEARLRAAVELMGGELEALAERRAAGDVLVSDRPERAMAALRGALAELGLAAGVRGLRADRDAVVLGGEGDLPRPSTIPLRVSVGGRWDLALAGGALRVDAMDRRALVYASVAGGQIEQRLTRRPALVTALLGGGDLPWVVWSTSAEACARAEDRCLHRATGLAALLEDRQTLEPMVWLPAHPLGAAHRSVHVAGRTAWVVGRGPGGARVQRFPLPEPEVRRLGEEREAARAEADLAWDLDLPEGARLRWIDGDPPRLLFAAGGLAGELALRPGGAPRTFEGPGGRAEVAGCGGWLVAASERGAVVRAPAGEVRRRPQRLLPPEPRGLALLCSRGALEVFTLSEGRLLRERCDARGCGAVEAVVEGVARFDVARHRGASVIAWTDDAEEGAVRVTRLTPDGRERTRIPAPCWSDPPGGLCGEPRLAAEGGTLVLATRQGEDLRVLRSRDGRRFEPLAGLGGRGSM